MPDARIGRRTPPGQAGKLRRSIGSNSIENALGSERTEAQEKAWADVLAEIKRFDSADKILLSAPMWNYSIPYKLKHYIDLIMQPRETFSYNAETMQHYGLLKNRPVQLLLTRSSVMPGDFTDFQLPYLKFFFEYVGLRDISVVTAWRTTQPTAELRAQYLHAFEAEVREAARVFASKSGPAKPDG